MKIVQLLEKKNLTISKLAQEIGISRNTISKAIHAPEDVSDNVKLNIANNVKEKYGIKIDFADAPIKPAQPKTDKATKPKPAQKQAPKPIPKQEATPASKPSTKVSRVAPEPVQSKKIPKQAPIKEQPKCECSSLIRKLKTLEKRVAKTYKHSTLGESTVEKVIARYGLQFITQRAYEILESIDTIVTSITEETERINKLELEVQLFKLVQLAAAYSSLLNEEEIQNDNNPF